MSELTHFNQAGEAHMVDIADKDQTHRIGIAEGWISMHPETFALVEKGKRQEGRRSGGCTYCCHHGLEEDTGFDSSLPSDRLNACEC